MAELLEIRPSPPIVSLEQIKYNRFVSQPKPACAAGSACAVHLWNEETTLLRTAKKLFLVSAGTQRPRRGCGLIDQRRQDADKTKNSFCTDDQSFCLHPQ
jgi:hypothetical protein